MSEIHILAKHAVLAKHDDRKGRHYYTPASQADASVYSSDDPYGRHTHHATHSAKKPHAHPKSQGPLSSPAGYIIIHTTIH